MMVAVTTVVYAMAMLAYSLTTRAPCQLDDDFAAAAATTSTSAMVSRAVSKP